MKALHTLALVAALAAGQAYGACTYPADVGPLPDGSTATKEEMLAAKKKVTDFDKAIMAYTDCIRKEHEETLAKSTDLTEEQKKQMQLMVDQKHNAAVEADEALAARFNEQLRAYNAKAKEKK
jgi:Spy/CpxP family protein refolding chaperone